MLTYPAVATLKLLVTAAQARLRNLLSSCLLSMLPAPAAALRLQVLKAVRSALESIEKKRGRNLCYRSLFKMRGYAIKLL
jgi:hypothetical protein